jgi:flavin-dependent dehydrogenase
MPAEPRANYDVCVVGGGPAGATAACRLAALGHAVALAEAARYPRPHVGVSLSPAVLPLLDAIGARAVVEAAGFVRSNRTVIWWSEPAPVMRVDPGAAGLHVDRGWFDELLLRHAAAAGVTVFQPARASRPRRHPGGWQVTLDHGGTSRHLTARFLVDATGGRGLLPGRGVRTSVPLLALYAHWRGPARPEDTARVEAGEDEWFWYAPLGYGASIAAVFIDPKRVAAEFAGDAGAAYRALLARFRLLPGGPGSCIEGGVRARDASATHAEQSVGPDFIRVGDAGVALDPLSSQGVQSATASALQAAVVVNTLLTAPAWAEEAQAFYRDRQAERVDQHAARAARFYAARAAVCDRPFWLRRAAGGRDEPATPPPPPRPGPSARVRVSAAVRIRPVPVIRGDLVVAAPAVQHARMSRPVGYVGGIEIARVVEGLRAGRTLDDVARLLSADAPAELATQVAHWLWDQGVLVSDG